MPGRISKVHHRSTLFKFDGFLIKRTLVVLSALWTVQLYWAVPNVEHYFFGQAALFKDAKKNHAICAGCPESSTLLLGM